MRTKWIVTSLSALLVLGLVLAPLAVAGKGPRVKNGIVHACLKTKGKKAQRGTIRVVSSPRQCKKKKGERALTWTLAGAPSGGTGAEGPAGPRGETGPAGATGERGPQGESGPTVTVEDPLAETVAGQSKEIQVLLGKVGSLTGELLDLEKGLGTVKTSLTDLGTNLDKSLADVKTDLNGTIGGVKTDLEGQLGGLKTNVVDPLVSKVDLLGALEPLTDNVDVLNELPGKVTNLLAAVNGLEPLTDQVTNLSTTVGELAPLTDKVTQLVALPGEVNLLQGTTAGLATTLTETTSSTCKQLGILGEGVNTLGSSLTDLVGHLTVSLPVIGPILQIGEEPPVPGTIDSPKCE